MRVYAEIAIFALIAAGVHAAGFAVQPETGDDSSGDDGAFLMSLKASTAQMEQLVEDWTVEPRVTSNTPELTEVAPTLDKTPAAPEMVAVPDPVIPSVLPSQPTMPSANSEIALPKTVTEPAQKLVVKPEPVAVPKVRPKPRPAKIENAQKPEPKPKAKPKQAKKPKPQKQPKKKQTTQKKKPTAAQASQRKQKAAGQGGQTSAGFAGKAKVKSGSKQNSAKALNLWGAQVRRTIERRKKSVRGLKRRVRATVSVTVAANGQVLSYRIAKSSGNKKADAAALRAVNSAGRLPKAVKGVVIGKHTFKIPMIFNP